MKCFCSTCKENSLNTNDNFVLGGPYNGSMFDLAKPGAWRSSMFRQITSMTQNRLLCPRCEMFFIHRNGSVITEHGIVKHGQGSLDESITILREDGMLGHIVDSQELPGVDRVGLSAQERQDAIDALSFEDDDDSDEDHPNRDRTESEQTEPQEKENVLPLICPKCMKKYTQQRWYDKHVEGCEG